VTAVATLKSLADTEFTEEFCTNERNVRDSNGKQIVKPK